MKKEHSFMSADRYLFDFRLCRVSDGWAQIDTSQDASYYGQWANPFTLEIVSYVEGDVYRNTAESPEEFVAELRSIKAWTIERGHRFIGIDPGLLEQPKKRLVELGLGDLMGYAPEPAAKHAQVGVESGKT